MAWKIDIEIEQKIVDYVANNECWWKDIMVMFNLSRCRLHTILKRHDLENKPNNGMSSDKKEQWRQNVSKGTKLAYEEGRLVSPMKNPETAKKAGQNFKKTFERNRDEIVAKRNRTMAERCGTFEKAMEDRVAKIKKTYEEHYGSVEKAYDHIGQKAKETMIERYGVDNPLKNEEIKQQVRNTQIERYGAYGFQTQKQKDTMTEKYGVDHNWKSKDEQLNGLASRREHYKEYIEKGKAKKLELYGDPYFSRENIHKKYLYEGINFDSPWEIAFYIYHKDNGSNILRETKLLPFIFNDEEKFCIPDFEIDGQLYEIKGEQFIKEDGTWQNPFDHSQDELFEAKHKCLIKNNVNIVYDIDEYLSYVEDKYGKDYIKQFRRNENDNSRA